MVSVRQMVRKNQLVAYFFTVTVFHKGWGFFIIEAWMGVVCTCMSVHMDTYVSQEVMATDVWFHRADGENFWTCILFGCVGA